MGFMRSTFFYGEPAPHSGLEYVLQRFYSSMLDAFFRVRLYGDIPQTHQRKTEGKRLFSPMWNVPQSPTFSFKAMYEASKK